MGKLQLDAPWQDMIKAQQQDNGLILLPIELRHIESLENLPAVHRDPFDRLIIAQAIQETMTIITVDSVFADYPVPMIG